MEWKLGTLFQQKMISCKVECENNISFCQTTSAYSVLRWFYYSIQVYYSHVCVDEQNGCTKTTTILLTTGLNVLILIRIINLNNYISKLKLALKFLVPNIKLVDIDPTNLAYTNSNIDTLHKKMYPPTFLHHSCLSTCAEIGMRHAFGIKNVNNHYTPYCLNYNATHTQIIDLQKSYWNFFLRA